MGNAQLAERLMTNLARAGGISREVCGVLSIACLLLGGAGVAAAPLTVDEGILDHLVVHTTELPKDSGLLISLFSAEKADLGTGDTTEDKYQKRKDAAESIQKKGPVILASQIVTELTGKATFSYVKEAGGEIPSDALVVEGRFTVIQPGSRAKRWLVGFGKGKSGVQVEGTVKNAKGELLAEFTHMRNSGIGLAGGDYEKFLTDDTRDVGIDIAEFLRRWASGRSLAKE